MPRDEGYPTPLLNMNPSGLPGLFVVLVVVFGFSTLFVSRDVAEVLLWLMVAVILVACGFGAYHWLAGRRVTVTSGPRSMSLSKCLALIVCTFGLAFALGWVAERAGMPLKFRVLGISLGWPGVVASALFLIAFHLLSVRPVPK